VSALSTLTTGPSVQVGEAVRGDLMLFANAAVDDWVQIELDAAKLPEAETVSILFGDERLILEFYDVASLERLRDLADEGARRSRRTPKPTPPSPKGRRPHNR